MAEKTAHADTVDSGEFAEVIAGLQDQIDALTRTLEAHQRLFERLRVSGVFDDLDR